MCKNDIEVTHLWCTNIISWAANEVVSWLELSTQYTLILEIWISDYCHLEINWCIGIFAKWQFNIKLKYVLYCMIISLTLNNTWLHDRTIKIYFYHMVINYYIFHASLLLNTKHESLKIDIHVWQIKYVNSYYMDGTINVCS